MMKKKGASSCICLVILLFSCAVHSGENSDTTILAHNLSKIGRIVAVLNQYMKSECGVYLVSATEIQKNIVSELGELKGEVTGYSPTIWSGFEAEEEKINKGAKRWVESQIQRTSKLSTNSSFSCGVLFGEIMQQANRFNSFKLRVLTELRDLKTLE